jgi:hypothetical protein
MNSKKLLRVKKLFTGWETFIKHSQKAHSSSPF